MRLREQMGEAWVVTPSLAVGGGEWSAVRLANSLSRHGVPTTMVVLTTSGPLEARLAPEVFMWCLDAGRAASGLFGLVDGLRRDPPTTVISHQMRANRVILAARKIVGNPPYTLIVEHSLARRQLDQLRPITRRLVTPLLRSLYRTAPAIAAVSRCAAREIESTLNLDRRIHLLRNIVPGVEKLITNGAEGPADSSEHPDNQSPARLLFVGRLVPEKGVDTLLEALAIVRKRIAATLQIVGDGPYREQIQRQVIALGLERSVDLLGFRNDVRRRMRDADVLVLPSRVEAMPTVLIEALAEGTSVVATDVPCGPAEVLAHGRFGRLVPPDAPGSLARAIVGELKDPRDHSDIADHLRQFSEGAVLRQLGGLLGSTND